jgi:hypothetical protein
MNNESDNDERNNLGVELWSPIAQSQPVEPFIDAVEAGKFLSLRPRRVLELARAGQVPAYPLGTGERKVWRFRKSELASAVLSRRVDCTRQSPAPRQEIT